MLIGVFWLPYSPRWLTLVERYQEARETLHRIHPDTATTKFHQIKAKFEHYKANKLGIKDVFRKPSYMRGIALVAGFFFSRCAQMSFPFPTIRSSINSPWVSVHRCL